MTVPFKKPEIEKRLSAIRDLNSDLSLQRSYLKRFQDHTPTKHITQVHYRKLPEQYLSIQNVARTLHGALAATWCCKDTAHTDHCAKLCIDADFDVERNVCVDMAISCQRNNQNSAHEAADYEPPVWLYVQSMMVDSKDLRQTSFLPTPAPPASPSIERRPKRRRLGVRFADDLMDPLPDTEAGLNEISAAPATDPTISTNLRETENVCRHFKLKTCPKFVDS